MVEGTRIFPARVRNARGFAAWETKMSQSLIKELY